MHSDERSVAKWIETYWDDACKWGAREWPFCFVRSTGEMDLLLDAMRSLRGTELVNVWKNVTIKWDLPDGYAFKRALELGMGHAASLFLFGQIHQDAEDFKRYLGDDTPAILDIAMAGHRITPPTGGDAKPTWRMALLHAFETASVRPDISTRTLLVIGSAIESVWRTEGYVPLSSLTVAICVAHCDVRMLAAAIVNEYGVGPVFSQIAHALPTTNGALTSVAALRPILLRTQQVLGENSHIARSMLLMYLVCACERPDDVYVLVVSGAARPRRAALLALLCGWGAGGGAACERAVLDALAGVPRETRHATVPPYSDEVFTVELVLRRFGVIPDLRRLILEYVIANQRRGA